MCKKTMQPWICSEPIGGHQFLLADLTVECWTDDHNSILAYSAVMIIVWPVGVPLVFFVAMKRSGQAREVVFSLLCKSYEPEFWYWECVDLLRKFLLAGVAPVLWRLPTVQFLFTTLLLTLFLCQHLKTQPYADPVSLVGVCNAWVFQ